MAIVISATCFSEIFDKGMAIFYMFEKLKFCCKENLFFFFWAIFNREIFEMYK